MLDHARPKGHGTAIEWTHCPGFKGETWNPVTGCRPCSEGCDNCYAATLAGTRLKKLPSRQGLTKQNASGEHIFNGKVRFNVEWLLQPLRWRKPRCVFVVAHGDLFYEAVEEEIVDTAYAVMALTARHFYLVLTKRSKRLRAYSNDPDTPGRIVSVLNDKGPGWGLTDEEIAAACHRVYNCWPLSNVGAGISVENQARAEERIPDILETSAAMRWVSFEPLIGRVDIANIVVRDEAGEKLAFYDLTAHGGPGLFAIKGDYGRRLRDVPQLDWAVPGGESDSLRGVVEGRGARPPHPDWFRDLLSQCSKAGIGYFFKQWGVWLPYENAIDVEGANVLTGEIRGFGPHDPGGNPQMLRVGKKLAGAMLDGSLHRSWPQLMIDHGRAHAVSRG
jgi:protein gp37